MVVEELEKDSIVERPAFQITHELLLLLGLSLLIGAALGYALRAQQVPGPDSADVGFARDMRAHHAQAVEMARLLYDRTEDGLMRAIAFDIMLGQHGEIGIMRGWLDAWGYSANSAGPSMAWMQVPTTGLMPGMAAPEEMARLRAAQGEAADVLFMQLMIPHHQAGVTMAEAAADMAETPLVIDVARTMAEGQRAEIDLMQQLLVEKGYEPVPESPMDMSHD